MLIWTLLISCLNQLIAISIYGGKGIGRYELYEPDYSLIIACIALGVNFFSSLLFLIEIYYYPRAAARSDAVQNQTNSTKILQSSNTRRI
jgi:hypothetical protein